MPQLKARTISELTINHCDQSPDISIVVTTYNHNRWIEECLEGILKQDFAGKKELLLVDHSSTDGTFETAINYWKSASGFSSKFIQKDRTCMKRVNGRPTGHGNLIEMLGIAKGKFIAICSGDDVWIESFKLTKQIALFKRFKGLTIVWSNTLIGEHIDKSRPSILAKSRIDLADYRYQNINGDAASTALFLKSSLNTQVFSHEFSSVPYDDWSIHMLCLENGFGMRLSEITTFYRQHPDNMMKSVVNEFGLIEWIQSLNYYSDYFQKLDYTELSQRINERIYTFRMKRVESDLKIYVENLPFRKAMIVLLKRATTRIFKQLILR